MEFPPDTYFIFPAEHFETAGPRIIGDYTEEILAQVRLNGRVMDHWRVVLGGSKVAQGPDDQKKHDHFRLGGAAHLAGGE